MSDSPTPSGYITQQVDVRIIRGVYTPCRSCHWYGVCVVPQNKQFQTFKPYFGSDDIHYNDNDGLSAGRPIYTCYEYTVKPN